MKLKYQYHFHHSLNTVFQFVLQEQLKFFQTYDHSIKELSKDTVIEKEMFTKTSKKAVLVNMKVNELLENQKIEIVTMYQGGYIVTTYEFIQENDGCIISYSEDNYFNKTQNELNFNIVSLFYRWIYKKNMKKRMLYIENHLERERLA